MLSTLGLNCARKIGPLQAAFGLATSELWNPTTARSAVVLRRAVTAYGVWVEFRGRGPVCFEMRLGSMREHVFLVGWLGLVSFLCFDEEPLLDFTDLNVLHVWVLVLSFCVILFEPTLNH